MTAPLWVRGPEARRILGIGRDTFRRWVKTGRIPHRTDPDTGTRWYPVPALHADATNCHKETS